MMQLIEKQVQTKRICIKYAKRTLQLFFWIFFFLEF